MKKTLASCLTALTLLSSMGFSSPTQPVHATEPEVVTPVNLKIKELPDHEYIWYTNDSNHIIGAQFKVTNIPEEYTRRDGGSLKRVTSLNEGKGYEIYEFIKDYGGSIIEYSKNPEDRVYQINYNSWRKQGTVPEEPFEIDISKPGSTDNKIISKFETRPGLLVDKTAQTVHGKLGEIIKLNFPEDGDKIDFTKVSLSNFKADDENVEADKIIEWDGELSGNSLSGKISKEVQPGTKLTFDLTFVAQRNDVELSKENDPIIIDSNTYPVSDTIFTRPKRFTMPVELTLGEKPNPGHNPGEPPTPKPNPQPVEKDENTDEKDEIKDEINSEKEPSSSEDENPVDKEENDNEESSTAVKTGDNRIYAIIFAAFAAIIAKVLISLCSKKTVKK